MYLDHELYTGVCEPLQPYLGQLDSIVYIRQFVDCEVHAIDELEDEKNLCVEHNER